MRDPVEITLAGRVRELTPDFRAIAAIERDLGASVSMTAVLHDSERLTLLAVARIVLEGLKSTPYDGSQIDDPARTNVDHLAEELFNLGVGSDALRQPESEFLEALCFTPEQILKKREAAAQDQTDLLAAMSNIGSALPQ